MTRLFQRPDGSPMPFHLADLPEKLFESCKNLIVTNGGKLEPIEKKNVLTFTNPCNAFSYKVVFDVKFIEDCVKWNKILDVNKYYIGDSRMMTDCPMSKMICGSKSCLLTQLGGLSTSNESILPTQNQNSQKAQKRPLESPSLFATKKPAKSVKEITEKAPNREVCKKADHNEELDFVDSDQSDKISFADSDDENEKIGFVDSDDENEMCCNEDEDIPQRNSQRLQLLKGKITPEIREWIEKLNMNRAKDNFGYPKKVHRSYTTWESRNILDFVIKTNTIHMVHSKEFWEEVYTLKLAARSRIYKSLYKHFNYHILPRIEKFRLSSEIEAKFVKWRNTFEEDNKERQEKNETNRLEKANKNSRNLKE